MSKLSDFLEQQGISQRQLLASSKKLESLRSEDYAIRLAKRRVRAGSASDAEKAQAETKGRSGKPVSQPSLSQALKGEKISGPAKTRIVRAINQVLKQKKKDEVELRALF